MGPGMLRAVALWLDQRLHVTRLFASTAGHVVPASAHSWFYVFGSGTLLCFVIQVVTGICLAFVYAPTAHDAWTSLLFLNYQQPLGWFLRAMRTTPQLGLKSQGRMMPRCACATILTGASQSGVARASPKREGIMSLS